MTTCSGPGLFLERHADASRTLPLSHRISRTSVARLVTFPSPILTAILPVKGISHSFWSSLSVLIQLVRILEYLSREDAERAVKELDGKDLRGQAVRVDLFGDVSLLPDHGDVFLLPFTARP